MIFLAVTLGFFAESLREKINDDNKERNYIKSLIVNLQQDTDRLKEAINDNRMKMAGLDKIISLHSADLKDPEIRRQLYYSSGNIMFYSAFLSNDATMLQLKTGGFQYVQRSHAADSIAYYDQVVQSVYAAETPYSAAIKDATEALTKFLVLPAGKTDSLNSAVGDFALLSTDQQNINLFFNKVWVERSWTENYVNHMEKYLLYPAKLSSLLQKEYGIE
jgi:hypothetical protein